VNLGDKEIEFEDPGRMLLRRRLGILNTGVDTGLGRLANRHKMNRVLAALVRQLLMLFRGHGFKRCLQMTYCDSRLIFVRGPEIKNPLHNIDSVAY
jgi:hypothetical protein